MVRYMSPSWKATVLMMLLSPDDETTEEQCTVHRCGVRGLGKPLLDFECLRLESYA